MAPWLSEGLTALIAGLGTVFLVLILISIIISLFKYINKYENKSKNKKVSTPKVEEVVKVVDENNEKVDDYELVAVITSVIAASLNTTTDKLQIKSFKRVGSTRGNWVGR